MLERELTDGEAMRELIWVIDRLDELALADGVPDPVDAAELTCRNLDALVYAFRRQTTMAGYAVSAFGQSLDRGTVRAAAASSKIELLGMQILPLAREQRDLLVSLLDVAELAELERRLAGER